MKKIKILIAEDDVLISEELSAILEDYGYEVVGIAEDYEAAVAIIESSPAIDLAILDINMHGREQGFEIAAYLAKNYPIPYLFLSSYFDAKTLEKAGALLPQTYLTKPFKKEQIYSAINIIVSSQTQKHILIKDGIKKVKISIEDILWIKSEGIYIELQTKTLKKLIRSSLKSFLDEYEINGLLQVHRSYLVNMNNATSISSSAITLDNNEIPISRAFKEDVSLAFNKLNM
jgi:DNA-binding LytR/AlgR family response regulator